MGKIEFKRMFNYSGKNLARMPEVTAHHSGEDIIKTSGFCFLFCLNELKELQQKSISSNRGSLNLSYLVQRREYLHGTKNVVSF